MDCHPSATGLGQDRESLPAKDRRSAAVPRNQSLGLFLTFPIPAPVTTFSFNTPLYSSITPSLFHSRLKPTFFTTPSPGVLLLPSPRPDCLHGLKRGPFLLSYSVFHFSFFLVFMFLVPCARLSCIPFRQLLSARKYAISYRVFSPALNRSSCAYMTASLLLRRLRSLLMV